MVMKKFLKLMTALSGLTATRHKFISLAEQAHLPFYDSSIRRKHHESVINIVTGGDKHLHA
jgi:K+/H+ antiporter YhaU regulatory subunit KhtT